MNNLDKILDKIEAEARRQIGELRAGTDARIEALEKETERLIAEAEQKAALQTEKEEAAIASRSTSAAAMRSREVVLTEKARLLAEVYARAEAQILALPEKEYGELLAGLAAHAVAERVNTVRFLRDEYKDEAFDGELEAGFTLMLSADDRKKYGDTVLSSACMQVAAVVKDPPVLRLSEEDAKIRGGVVVCYGDTETTCSIPVLLAGLRDELDPVIMKTLLP
ncbi:MAG: V-type ATP synthase subunit E [Clostridia bacterium]|nr:V-type ATP synthase subunit E [Clostridia bacterium]